MSMDIASTAQREYFGVNYDVAVLDNGIKLYVPEGSIIGEQADFIDDITSSYSLRFSSFDRDMPLRYGYRWRAQYANSSDWPNSDVYYNEEHDLYLKNPVFARYAVPQAFVMNGLSKGIPEGLPVSVVESPMAFTRGGRGASMAFYTAARGVSSVNIYYGANPNDDYLKNRYFYNLRSILMGLVQEIPRPHRSLVNDTPANYGTQDSRGRDNVFISTDTGASQREIFERIVDQDAEGMHFTFIDQGNLDANIVARLLLQKLKQL